MGYEISIRRGNGMIPLSEWKTAVENTAGVRFCTGSRSITNPKTGEVITIPNSGGDAEIFLTQEAKWISAFHWRRIRGDITFKPTHDFSDRSNALAKIAQELAFKLNAQLIGDDGEIYS